MKKILCLLAAVALLLLAGCKSGDYKKATELYEGGNYEEAVSIFQELGDYENSVDMVTACKYQMALAAINDGDYDAALSMLEELGDYEDSVSLAADCRWYKAAAALDGKTGSVIINNTVYTLMYNVSGDKITISASGTTAAINMHLDAVYNIVITKGQSEAQMDMESIITIGYKTGTASSSGSFDISGYTDGQSLSWDTVSPAEIDMGNGVMTISSDDPTFAFSAIMKDMSNHLGGSAGTMADLGFLTY